jgi:hypothetical protein
MSYSLMPYAVDLQRLRSAVGSKDEALLAEIQEANPATFADDDPDEDEISVGGALRDLIMGHAPVVVSAHQYGYALKVLVEHLGEWLPSDMWEGITWRVLQTTGMGDLLQNSGSPIPLPKMDDGFPVFGHLTAERVKELASKLGDTPPTTVDLSGKKKRRGLQEWLVDKVVEKITHRSMPGDEDLVECMEEYAGWLREAAAKGQALVFFYY